nr:hypothetical protein Iba_chr14aCG7480 [Ipomoea batatas]
MHLRTERTADSSFFAARCCARPELLGSSRIAAADFFASFRKSFRRGTGGNLSTRPTSQLKCTASSCCPLLISSSIISGILSVRPSETASLGICFRQADPTTSFRYKSKSPFLTIPKVSKCCRKVCTSGVFTFSIPPLSSKLFFHVSAISLAFSLTLGVTSILSLPSNGSIITGIRDSSKSTHAHPKSLLLSPLLSFGNTSDIASSTNFAGSTQSPSALGISDLKTSNSFFRTITKLQKLLESI